MVKIPLIHLFSKREGCLELLENIVGVIESCDPNLEGHSLNVKNLTLMLFEMLPFTYRIQIDLYQLSLAALLLDLGKLGLPREIINKAGKLEDKEKRIMSHHPEIGAMIISRVRGFNQVSQWVKYHHERFDGKGIYHMKGKKIPLESRILAVVDTFSALIMDRSYKSSMSYPEAISELRLVAGTQLDAEIVEYFCRIPPKKIERSLNKVQRKIESLTYNTSDFE